MKKITNYKYILVFLLLLFSGNPARKIKNLSQ
jgi:hypothetical protein